MHRIIALLRYIWRPVVPPIGFIVVFKHPVWQRGTSGVFVFVVLFGGAVGFSGIDDIDQAIAMANDTNYGLSAAIFTENLNWALKFAQQVESGNIHVNWGTQWRAELMPYGGLKESGMGKEGPKDAVQEMTETKMVVIH